MDACLRELSAEGVVNDRKLVPVDIPASMDDELGREASGGASETDINQEPYEGMIFESEEAARGFYDEYAARVGFITRVLSSRRSERDGSAISRGLGCRGGSDNHKSTENRKTEGVPTRRRDSRREGCTAMVLVKKDKSGRWVVRKFVRDHTHPLGVSPTNRRPAFDEKDKKIQDLTSELRVKKRLSAAYREQLLALMKDVEDHNEHLSLKLNVVRNNIRELEAIREKLSHNR